MVLYTIGYEGLDSRRFLKTLICNGIDMVVDVRKLPLSRKKGFSKTALKELLNGENIEYQNYQELGAPKEIREELYQSGDYTRFFERFLKCITERHDLLEDIHALVNSGKTVSLLCYERNPEQCHRKVVAEQVKKVNGNGLKIKHILPI